MKFKLYTLMLISTLSGCNDSDNQAESDNDPVTSSPPTANINTDNDPIQQVKEECVYIGRVRELDIAYRAIDGYVRKQLTGTTGCGGAIGEEVGTEVFLDAAKKLLPILRSTPTCNDEATQTQRRINEATIRMNNAKLYREFNCNFLGE